MQRAGDYLTECKLEGVAPLITDPLPSSKTPLSVGEKNVT